MPKVAKTLTPIEISRLSHPGTGRNVKISVGGVAGLMIQITPAGAKSWVLRTVVGERRREIGLGSFPTVSLAQARDRARRELDLIHEGIDPVEQRKAAKAALAAAQRRGLTFSAAVEKYIASGKLDKFRSRASAVAWKSTIDQYAKPAIGPMLVCDIEPADILRVLPPIWGSSTQTASRLRGRIEAVLSWATVAGHRTGDNPARWVGNLDQLLGSPKKIAPPKHHPALALDDAAGWFAALKAREGTAARVLEFIALTACRSGEARGATWAEIDLDARLWTIPAARMKAGREHRAPLSEAAVALLRALPKREDCPLIFPSLRGKVIARDTLSGLMKAIHAGEVAAGGKGWLDPRSGEVASPHGLRSTFRDWVSDRTDYPAEMAEMALAHTLTSAVEQAYRRGDMLDRRRAMAAAWSRALRGETGAAVVRFEDRRA